MSIIYSVSDHSKVKHFSAFHLYCILNALWCIDGNCTVTSERVNRPPIRLSYTNTNWDGLT